MSTPLSIKAYQHIQRQILNGQLAAGMPISEQSLAGEIGMSRTPVREAVRQLVSEGVLEQVPRYGTLLRLPDRREIEELFHVREALECYAAAGVSARITARELEGLYQLCGTMEGITRQLEVSDHSVLDATELQHFLAADSGFHMLILRSLGNRQFMKIIGNYRVVARIFAIQRQDHDLSVVKMALTDHLVILKALEDGNGGLARRAMSEHIRRSKAKALETFDRRRIAGMAEERAGLQLPQNVVEQLKLIGYPVDKDANTSAGSSN